MKKHEMENKMEAAFNSLDHAHRAGPGPFFFTRLQARLRKKDKTFWDKISSFIAQPAIAFTVVCLVISLNTLVILQKEPLSGMGEQGTLQTYDDSDADTIAFYDEEINNSDTQ